VGKSFLVVIKFATKMQLEGLTHMFCFLMSSYKVYKDFLKIFHIKNHVSCVWNQRILTLKIKHKIK
jgi:hypothetical protein